MRRVGNASGVHRSTAVDNQSSGIDENVSQQDTRSMRTNSSGALSTLQRVGSPRQSARPPMQALSRAISNAEFENQLEEWVHEEGFEDEIRSRRGMADHIKSCVQSREVFFEILDYNVTSLPYCIKYLQLIDRMHIHSKKLISIPALPHSLVDLQLCEHGDIKKIDEIPETLSRVKISEYKYKNNKNIENVIWLAKSGIEKKDCILRGHNYGASLCIAPRLLRVLNRQLIFEINREENSRDSYSYSNSSPMTANLGEDMSVILKELSRYSDEPVYFFRQLERKIPFVNDMIEWASFSDSFSELENRLKVIEKIIEAVESNNVNLNLNNLGITSLPNCIGYFYSLKKLSVSGNLISSINRLPLTLKEFHACGTLLVSLPPLPYGLQNLEITENPNLVTLPTLPRDLMVFKWNKTSTLTINSVERAYSICDPVPINDNPQPSNLHSLSTTELDQSSTHETRSAPSESDSVYYPMDDAEFSEALYLQSVYDLQSDHADRLASEAGPSNSNGLTQWRQPAFPNARIPRTLEASRAQWAPVIEQYYAEENAEAFTTFLDRLAETAEYVNQPTPQRAEFVIRINDILSAIHASPALRGLCFNIAQEATERCGDRVALVLNQMELAVIDHDARRGRYDMRELFELGQGQFRLHKLDEIATEHIDRMLRSNIPVDEVEVRLGYQTILSEELQLPAVGRSMLYSSVAGIGDAEVDEAIERARIPINSIESVTFMAGWMPWQNAIEAKYPEEFAAQRRVFEPRRANLTQPPDGMSDNQYLEECRNLAVREREDMRDMIIQCTRMYLQ